MVGASSSGHRRLDGGVEVDKLGVRPTTETSPASE